MWAGLAQIKVVAVHPYDFSIFIDDLGFRVAKDDGWFLF